MWGLQSIVNISELFISSTPIIYVQIPGQIDK